MALYIEILCLPVTNSDLIMYHDEQAMALPYHTSAVLRVLDETLLTRGYNKAGSIKYTKYSAASGIGEVTVRHDLVPHGVLAYVEGVSFGLKTAAELVRKLRDEGLIIERGQGTSEDGRFFIISEDNRRYRASNGI